MRKIRLDPDALAVDSFALCGAGETPAGTVRGHQSIPTLDTGYHGCYACPATVLTCGVCTR